MQQTVIHEQPQFTDLATFALRLAQATLAWHDPQSGADIFTYFQSEHTGDEHSLRASLVREHILPTFNYMPAQIEYESKERFDLVLRSQNQHHRRRIAIIETTSSTTRNLATIHGKRETPLELLERYLLQAGLYLGVLTNGDEWHLFDFALGCYAEFLHLCTFISHTDLRSFQELLHDAIENVGKFGTAFSLYDDGQLRAETLALLHTLAEQYLVDGDIAAFEGDYLQQAGDILTKYHLHYRAAIGEFGMYHLLHQRWDLFVPFFERNLQFLRSVTGRLSLIVSRGIETEGYAEKLRQLLSTQYRILQIDFFPELRLFQDAAIENTIITLEKRAPDETHEVIRRKHSGGNNRGRGVTLRAPVDRENAASTGKRAHAR